MGAVLAYAEVRDGALRGVARETVSAARQLASELGSEAHALVIGPPGIDGLAADLASGGADRIFLGEGEAFANYHPDGAVRAIERLLEARDYSAVLFPASAQGKDLAPRVAARLDRGLATEVTEVAVEEGRVVATRPVYGGKAYARVGFSERPALLSLRPNVFLPTEAEGRGEVERLTVEAEPARLRVRGIEQADRGRLDVAEAGTVVSGGRGLQGSENWHLLEELVEALGDGAALGASRAVVDAGWRPHPEQVGQTGKTISPNLYFAVGISGAIQHQAGMRTAKVIVAINKDREAPIFKIADYGIVGDLFEVVPRLTEEIRKLRSEG
ncbi:MAG: electron transfer flavoprotein subunit alpha/FixB family protein [Gemmatimonadota bacterium]